MSRYDDLEDFDFDREDGGVVSQGGGGGAGPVLGIFLTLLLIAGVGYAAYKFGERRQVTEPPMIAAADGPAKIAPEDPGGAAIPNTDNEAYVLVDGARSEPVDAPVYDGAVVDPALPQRSIDPASAIGAQEVRREIVDLTDVPLKSSIEGEPELTPPDAPDRQDERLLAGGADVAIARRAEGDDVQGDDVQGDDVQGAAAGDAAPVTASVSTNAAGAAQQSGAAQAGADRAAADPGAGDGSATAQQTNADAGDADSLAGSATGAPGGADAAPEPVAETQIAVAPAPAAKPQELGPESFGPGLSIPAPRMKPQLGPDARQPVASEEPRTVTPPNNRVVMTPDPQPKLTPPPPAPAPRPQPASTPRPSGPPQVQLLGAFASVQQAREAWSRLRAQHPDLLGPLSARVAPVTASDGRRLYLLRAGGERLRDGRMAELLCAAIGNRGVDCSVPTR